MAGQGFESILECLPPKCMKERNVGYKRPPFTLSRLPSAACVCLCAVWFPTPTVACSRSRMSSARQLLRAFWLPLLCTPESPELASVCFAASGLMFLFSVWPSCVFSHPCSSICLSFLFLFCLRHVICSMWDGFLTACGFFKINFFKK